MAKFMNVIKSQQTKPNICADNDSEQLPPQKRCELVLTNQYPYHSFKQLDANNGKKTYCYHMAHDMTDITAYCYANFNIDQNIMNFIYSYLIINSFIKIHEDHKSNPTRIPSLLLKPKFSHLENDLVLPIAATSSPIQEMYHNYYIAQYPLIQHRTLESITYTMMQCGILNPLYFKVRRNNMNHYPVPWKSFEYKLIVLKLLARVIEIAIKMYESKLIDLDTTVDNFVIILLSKIWRWEDLTPENLRKIDHESMLRFHKDAIAAWKMRVPMKEYATPPELSYADENDMIAVMPVITYQLAAVCMFALFAQVFVKCKDGDKDRMWCTLQISNGAVEHIAAGWNPAYLTPDLQFLAECMAESPSKRPGIHKLLGYVQESINQTKEVIAMSAQRKSGNFVPRNKRVSNILYGRNNHRNNGPPAIIYNRGDQQQILPNTQQRNFPNNQPMKPRRNTMNQFGGNTYNAKMIQSQAQKLKSTANITVCQQRQSMNEYQYSHQSHAQRLSYIANGVHPQMMMNQYQGQVQRMRLQHHSVNNINITNDENEPIDYDSRDDSYEYPEYESSDDEDAVQYYQK